MRCLGNPADGFTGTHIDQAEHLAKVQFTTFLHDNYGLDYIEVAPCWGC